jgi:hypothetical protein
MLEKNFEPDAVKKTKHDVGTELVVRKRALNYHYFALGAGGITELIFVNLLRSLGIDSQPGAIDSLESIPGLLKR